MPPLREPDRTGVRYCLGLKDVMCTSWSVPTG
jgi:hypothetical protein